MPTKRKPPITRGPTAAAIRALQLQPAHGLSIAAQGRHLVRAGLRVEKGDVPARVDAERPERALLACPFVPMRRADEVVARAHLFLAGEVEGEDEVRHRHAVDL